MEVLLSNNMNDVKIRNMGISRSLIYIQEQDFKKLELSNEYNQPIAEMGNLQTVNNLKISIRGIPESLI